MSSHCHNVDDGKGKFLRFYDILWVFDEIAYVW